MNIIKSDTKVDLIGELSKLGDKILDNMPGSGKKEPGFLQKLLDKLADHPAIYRIEYGDDRESIYMQMLPAKNPPAKAKRDGEKAVVGKDDPEYVDIKFEDASTKDHVEEYTNVKLTDKNIQDTIYKYMGKHIDWYGTDSYKTIYEVQDTESTKGTKSDKDTKSTKDTKSNNKLSVELTKINGSTDVDLVSVNCNCSTVEAMDILQDVVSDDAFIQEIPEDETTCYEIEDVGDDYAITPCESVQSESMNTMFTSVLRPVTYLINNIDFINSNSVKCKYGFESSWVESTYWICKEIQSEIIGLIREFVGVAPNVATYFLDEYAPILTEVPDESYKISYICSTIDEILASLELYYCNLDHDIQSLYDKWIRSLKSVKVCISY